MCAMNALHHTHTHTTLLNLWAEGVLPQAEVKNRTELSKECWPRSGTVTHWDHQLEVLVALE
jgi:hypothetical protein